MSKKGVLKIGLSHALDTAGPSRVYNLRLANFWRMAISSIEGFVCIAPWIDIAAASPKPINRTTREGKTLLSKVLAIDVQVNELMDLLVVVISPGGGLSEGQQFENETQREHRIPILTVLEADIGDLILDPDGFKEEILETIRDFKKGRS